MIFVDSNIVIDLVEDGEWTAWSKRMLAEERRPLIANHIVFAEIGRAFGSADAVLTFLGELGVRLDPITPEIAFRAGSALIDHRMAGGRHQAILADFLIGAHAANLNAPLVTRDRRRFRIYFPELTLITPETHP